MNSAYHHIGVGVSDIEAASHFYQAALDGRVLVSPYVVSGEVAERITGVPGASMRMCQMGFDEGFVELFEFQPDDLKPSSTVPYTHRGVLHFGLRVDDVAASLARVEAHGGSCVFSPRPLGDIMYCYCRDPDGNVIELASGPMDHIVALVGARERD